MALVPRQDTRARACGWGARGVGREAFLVSWPPHQAWRAALAFRWRPYFIGAFGTGLGPSEQLALTRERIDFGWTKIGVREGWRKGQRTVLEATTAIRAVDILPPVRKALDQLRLIAGGRPLGFPIWRGRHINASNPRRWVWYTALDKAGLERRDIYDTRHTFATHALASGEDP